MKGTVILKMFMVVALFFLSSCKEYFITTKVNSDGTIERTFILKVDDHEDKIPEYFNAPEWTHSLKSDSARKEKTITFTRKYSSFDEISQTKSVPFVDLDKFVNIKVEKQFKFFFTYYSYKETYKSFGDLRSIPFNKIFTLEEIDKIKTWKDSSWSKQRIDLLNAVVLLEGCFKEMKGYLSKEANTGLSRLDSPDERIKMYKEIAHSNNTDDESNRILSKYTSETACKEINEFFTDKTGKWKETESGKKENAKEVFSASYNNSILLPGIITSSNAKTIEGNKVSWKFDQEIFKFFDYEMSAESREVNTWFIIVSGIIVLLLITLLILPKFRKKAAF
jgi:hypothetical protein